MTNPADTLRALHEAATPEPWEAVSGGIDGEIIVYRGALFERPRYEDSDNNEALIVALRNITLDVADLLDVLDGESWVSSGRMKEVRAIIERIREKL